MVREIFWDTETKFENTRKLLHYNERFWICDLTAGKRKNPPNNCNFLMTISAINWNGFPSPCCGLYVEKFDFGNAFYSASRLIWNNHKYGQTR